MILSIGPARSSKSMLMRVGWGERQVKGFTTTAAEDERAEERKQEASLLDRDLFGREKRLRDV